MILGAFVITGCSDDDINSNENRQNTSHLRVVEIDLIQEFEDKFNSIEPQLREIIETPNFRSNPELYERDLELVLEPLVGISQRLTIAVDINENEVPELVDNSLSNQQIVAIGTLIYAYETNSSNSSVTACIAYAFIGLDLHGEFWGNFTNRRALIRAVGKVASRYLGVVGAALIVYDFIDCMWG